MSKAAKTTLAPSRCRAVKIASMPSRASPGNQLAEQRLVSEAAEHRRAAPSPGRPLVVYWLSIRRTVYRLLWKAK